jgi:hypothetical protein
LQEDVGLIAKEAFEALVQLAPKRAVETLGDVGSILHLFDARRWFPILAGTDDQDSDGGLMQALDDGLPVKELLVGIVGLEPYIHGDVIKTVVDAAISYLREFDPSDGHLNARPLDILARLHSPDNRAILREYRTLELAEELEGFLKRAVEKGPHRGRDGYIKARRLLSALVPETMPDVVKSELENRESWPYYRMDILPLVGLTERGREILVDAMYGSPDVPGFSDNEDRREIGQAHAACALVSHGSADTVFDWVVSRKDIPLKLRLVRTFENAEIEVDDATIERLTDGLDTAAGDAERVGFINALGLAGTSRALGEIRRRLADWPTSSDMFETAILHLIGHRDEHPEYRAALMRCLDAGLLTRRVASEIARLGDSELAAQAYEAASKDGEVALFSALIFFDNYADQAAQELWQRKSAARQSIQPEPLYRAWLELEIPEAVEFVLQRAFEWGRPGFRWSGERLAAIKALNSVDSGHFEEALEYAFETADEDHFEIARLALDSDPEWGLGLIRDQLRDGSHTLERWEYGRALRVEPDRERVLSAIEKLMTADSAHVRRAGVELLGWQQDAPEAALRDVARTDDVLQVRWYASHALIRLRALQYTEELVALLAAEGQRPVQWALLESILEVVDPDCLATEEDPCFVGDGVQGLPYPWQEHLRKSLEKNRKAKNKQAEKLDRQLGE